MNLADPVDWVQAARDEVTGMGFRELRTPAEVDEVLGQGTDTTLLFINSLCGCSSSRARPALAMALQSPVRPRNLVTVLAGQDREATARAREYLVGERPSSPSIALLKDGRLVYMKHREEIISQHPEALAADLKSAFATHCAG